jgi:LuxR family transcriptional regulator, maltose regulon positive regulatory protein
MRRALSGAANEALAKSRKSCEPPLRINNMGRAVSPDITTSTPAAIAADERYVTRPIEKKLLGWKGAVIAQAPAGFGKSVLLNALQRKAEQSDRAVARIDCRRGIGASGLEEALAELLKRQTAQPMLLVDEADLLDEGMCNHLGNVLDQHQDAVQFVIASRKPINIGVTRRMVAQKAILVGATDLRLNDAAIMQQLVRADLPDPSLRVAIARMTAGWPAGVYLAIQEAAKGALDRSLLIDRLTRRGSALEQFIAEEVLSALPPSTLALLDVLATLGRFSPALVASVADIENAEDRIAELESRGLFIEPIRGDWRAMNPLVGICLEARLRRSQPQKSRTLHLAATHWHEAQHQLSDAIAHSFAAGDAERAADLLAQSYSTHERIGRWRAFTDWTSRLSEEVLDRYPAIRLEAAPAHAVLFEFDAARAHVEKLQTRAQSLSASDKVALIGTEAILAAFADRPAEALEAGENGRAKGELADPYTRGVFYTASAIGCIAQGEITEANRLSIEARAIHESGGSSFGATFALALSGLTSAIGGKLDDAAAQWREGARLIRPSDNAPALEAVASGYMPVALYEWNELDEAQHLIDRSLASSVEVALPDAIASIYVVASRIAASRGDHIGVERWLNEAAALSVRRQWPRLYRAAAWERIAIALRQKRVAEARKLRKRLDREGQFAGTPIIDGLDVEGNCGELRYDLYVRSDRHAFKATRMAVSRALNEGRLWRAARLLAIEAVAREQLGDYAAALRAMRKSLEIGHAGRLLRTYIDEGPSAVALIAKIATEESRAPNPALNLTHLDEILEAGGEQRIIVRADEYVVEPLSKREAEVLTLVASGLSNRTLADRLFMSENTVKWHLQHVFAKLGVANRTSAIIVAREHGLID